MIQFSYVLLLSFFCCLSTLGQGFDSVKAFKQLLENQPHVREVVFALTKVNNMGAPEYYEAAYSDTNFYIRRFVKNENLDAPLSPTNPMLFPFFVGRVGSQKWEISGFNEFKTSTHSNNIDSLVQDGKYILNSTLVFGLFGIKPGSFVWNDNQFTAKRENNHLVKIEIHKKINGIEQVLQGDIKNVNGSLYVSNGFPVRIDCEGTSVYYEFSNNSLPEGVPETITITQRGHSPADYIEVISILRYISDSDLNNDYFQPERHVVPQYASIYTKADSRGGMVLSRDNSGNVAKTEVELLQKNKSIKRWTIIAVLIVVTGFPLVFALTRARQKKYNDVRTANDKN